MDLSDDKAAWGRLAQRFQQSRPGATGAVLTDFSRLSAGHSNDTYAVEIDWTEGGKKQSGSYVLRTAPSGVGLLEPYDIGKQYRVMDAVYGSKVPVPKMTWLDEDTAVLGKPYFVMERLNGEVVEGPPPEYLVNAEPAKIRRISQRYVETVAAIHTVDWKARGLGFLGDGQNMLDRELDWWGSEIARYQQGPLPAFERVDQWLRANKPQQTPQITLVHGDCKTGNMFLDDETLVAMFDWEMASVGDPMTDLGWFTCMWGEDMGVGLHSLPGAMTKQEVLAHYEKCSGIKVHDLKFYEVMAMYKVAAIVFVGSMLFDSGRSSDVRYLAFGPMVKVVLDLCLKAMGVSEPVPCGKVMSSWDRVLEGTSETLNKVVMPELKSQVARSQVKGIMQLLWFFSTGATPPPAAVSATPEEEQTRKSAPH